MLFFNFSIMCFSKLKLQSTMTPMSFSSLEFSNSTPIRAYFMYGSGLCLPICILLHFSGCNFNSHCSVHDSIACKSFCSEIWSSLVLITLKILLSSAKRYTVEFRLSGRSLIYIMNKIGPSTDPWGIPDVISCHRDSCPLTVTCCFLGMCSPPILFFHFLCLCIHFILIFPFCFG